MTRQPGTWYPWRSADPQALIDAAIAAGPPCVCTHPRSVHRKYPFFDGPCQVPGCRCTPAGYQFNDGRPYEAPDLEGWRDGISETDAPLVRHDQMRAAMTVPFPSVPAPSLPFTVRSQSVVLTMDTRNGVPMLTMEPRGRRGKTIGIALMSTEAIQLAKALLAGCGTSE